MLLRLIVTCFGAGLISNKMPGTIGSLFATLICIIIPKSSLLFFNIFLFLLIIGVLACQKYVDIYSDNKDPNFIVIDEVCAVFFINFLILSLYEYNIIYFIWSFILFRLFDIWKPWPIKNIEKTCKDKHNLNGIGIMIDDLLAGILSVIFIYIYKLIL